MTRVYPRNSSQSHMIFILIFLSCSNSLESIEYDAKLPNLLLVSFDGFRWDYLNRAHNFDIKTPNFDALIAGGSTVAAGGVKNSFPTKTLPNHFTMVTGMYPGNHGVVHNNYWDPKYGEFTGQDDIWWNNGTAEEDVASSVIPMPVWIANQRQRLYVNQSERFIRRSGVMMWPGASARLYNETAHKWKLYDYPATNESRIDEVIQWFTDEVEPINMAAMYFNEPDYHGHQWGPMSRDLMQLVGDLDGIVGYLLQLLRKNDLYDKMNLIITSDHGMGEIEERIILSEHLDLTTFKTYGSSPVLLIWPLAGFEETIYANASKIPKMTVYRKDEIPPEYHYTFNRRIPPLLFLADPGATFCTTLANCSNIEGNHGYTNNWSDMHPFFVAHGPAFKSNHISPEFNNVDMYAMMCQVLGITPGPHDGNLQNINNILRSTPHYSNIYIFGVVCFAVGVPIIIVGFIFTLKACRTRVLRYHRVSRDVQMSGAQESLLSSDDEI